MVAQLKSSSRGGARITKIVLHTAEGARTKEGLHAYFLRPDVYASSHVGVDADGISPPWVADSRAAWTLRSGNPYSLNAELCAFARWTRAQWLSTGWVDGCKNPRQIIRNAARWVAREAREHNIPIDWLTVGEFRRNEAGVADHDTYTDATGDGTHWDVGEGFPVDVFMADLRGFMGGGGGSAPPGEEDGMQSDWKPFDNLPRGVGKHSYGFSLPYNNMERTVVTFTPLHGNVGEFHIRALSNPQGRGLEMREIPMLKPDPPDLPGIRRGMSKDWTCRRDATSIEIEYEIHDPDTVPSLTVWYE